MKNLVRSSLVPLVVGLLSNIAVAQTGNVGADIGAANSATANAAAKLLVIPDNRYRLLVDSSGTPRLAGEDRKDPTVAGVLSFLIPGLGSFYAGNNTHGVIHLGIHLASYAMIVGGVASCDVDCSGLGTAAAGEVILLGNDIWSIFTAVSDAHAHNGPDTGSKPGRVVGSLYVSPDIRPLGIEQRGMTRSTGLQLLAWRF